MKGKMVLRGSKGKEYLAGISAGIISGIVFLVLLFGLQWSILVDVVLAVGSYAGFSLLLKPVRRIGTVSFDVLPNGEELEKYLSDAKEDHDMIEKALRKISNQMIKEEAEKLNQTAGTIIFYLEEHPDKIKLARQFIDYYQDTAASILKRYVELEDTNLNTSDVMKLNEDTLKSLQTLNVAFDLQFQKLLRNEMMDMDAQMRLFAALLANVLNGGQTVDARSVEQILPQLKNIFSKLGYMETSSSDLFSQFLRMGVGAKPMIAGYESQLLEYAAEKPEEYAKIKDDVVIIYPSPTVWSTHIYIVLNDSEKAGIDALSDGRIRQLAWEKHGFRTSSYDISSAGGEGGVTGIPEQVTAVMNMPEYDAMKKIIDYLQ